MRNDGTWLFNSLDKYQAWLEDLRVMDQDDDGVKLAVEEAEGMIAERKAGTGMS